MHSSAEACYSDPTLHCPRFVEPRLSIDPLISTRVSIQYFRRNSSIKVGIRRDYRRISPGTQLERTKTVSLKKSQPSLKSHAPQHTLNPVNIPVLIPYYLLFFSVIPVILSNIL